MFMGKRPGFDIDYERARQIVANFSINDIYLRSLVANVTGNTEHADSLDYRGLLSEGMRIKAVAKKILRRKPSKLETQTQGTLF